MAVSVLLDTNAYSRFGRRHEQVTGIVENAEEVLFSAIVMGELLTGFHAGSRFEQNLAELRTFLDNRKVWLVEVGPATAAYYGSISAALRAKGHPIPTNDIWIAAHAMETGADLVSADAHFEHVDGLAWTRVTPD